MKKIVTTCLALLFSSGLALAAAAEDTNVYREVSRHYEAIRLALLEDSLTGVAEHAEAIGQRVTALSEAFHAEQAGVSADKTEACKKLLPEIAVAAKQIATGKGLDAVRTAFFELSKPLGRYRKLTGNLDSKVVYCSMAKKAWIQPAGEIGNPYLGTSMPTCGQVIAD